jgi:hypothetical protein
MFNITIMSVKYTTAVGPIFASSLDAFFFIFYHIQSIIVDINKLIKSTKTNQ